MPSLCVAPGMTLTSLIESAKQSANSVSNSCTIFCCPSVISGPIVTSLRIRVTRSGFHGSVSLVKIESGSLSFSVVRQTGCEMFVDSVSELSACLGLKDCGTSLAGASSVLGPPIEPAVCFVTFIVVNLMLGFRCELSLCKIVVFEPWFLQIATVSVKKSCFARKRRRRGFPSKNSQPPLLSKTSNSPSTSMSPSLIFPCQTAFDGTIFPSAMHSRLLDVFHFPIVCFIRLKTDQQMA